MPLQGCKDGERGTGAEIGAKTDANRALLLYCALDIEEAAAEEEVGCRAVCDRRAGPVHYLHLVASEMDTVAKDSARPAQRVVIVNVKVAHAFRE